METKKKRFLEQSQILRIETLKFSYEEVELEKCRDAFLLACYTGLSCTDLISLSKDEIFYEESKGYSIERNKSKMLNGLRLPVYQFFNGKAEQIIERYQVPGRAYLFDEFTNQKLNKYLKLIAQRAGISENVTFHMGRHSFARHLIRSGLNEQAIGKYLGHS